MERTPHTSSVQRGTESLPEVHVLGSNLQYARLLMDDYAGPESELTAILTYNYQNTCFGQQYPDVARQLQRIAIDEMHHLHALGAVIHQLGADPRYRSSRNRTSGGFYTTEALSYSTSVPQFLHMNIRSEQVAIYNYQRHMQAIADPGIRNLLRAIIVQEQRHIALFESLLQSYAQNGWKGKKA